MMDSSWNEKEQETDQTTEDLDNSLPELVELGVDQTKETENQQVKDDTNEATYQEETVTEAVDCCSSEIPPTVADTRVPSHISGDRQFVCVGVNTDPEDCAQKGLCTATSLRLARLENKYNRIVKIQSKTMGLLEIIIKFITESN